MIQNEYWISELADRTNVSTRTIRYYINEGLLPQPEIRGKYAVFTDDYLQRLKLIKILKDAYLPLKEIKGLLDSLDETQVVALLEEFKKNPATALSSLRAHSLMGQAASIKESALEYIVRVREADKNQDATASPAPQPKSPNLLNNQPPTSQAWQRIHLVPGVELHLRQPLNTRQRQLAEQLIQFAQELFLNQ